MMQGVKQEENVTELWKRYRQGIEYQEKIGIRTEIPRYIDFYEGRQWPKATEATKNLPRPVVNFVKMICRNKKAAILASKVRILYKSDSPEADVDKFNEFASFVGKEMDQDGLDKRAVEDGVKKGSYFYHYYWDPNAEGKDATETGALRCELIDPLNIFFENPCELDEQKQGWIVVVTRESVDLVRKKADKDVNLEEIMPDELENDAYGTKEQDSDKLCTLITCYSREGGRVVCSRATKTTVVNKAFGIIPRPEKMQEGDTGQSLSRDATAPFTQGGRVGRESRGPRAEGMKLGVHELYPIVAGYYEMRDRCIYGISEIEGLIPNQKAVNFHIAMSLLNAQENAWGKYIALPDALQGQKITNAPGQVLIDYSKTGNGIKKMTEQAMHSFPLEVINTLVNLTRSVSGASEVMTGETIGANMSGAAIAQLQAQAQMPIEDLRDTFWQVKKKQGKVLAQFYKYFYLDADFSYETTDPSTNEKSVISDKFSSQDFEALDFDIVVEATQGTRSSAASDIAMLDGLLSGGHIGIEAYVNAYPDEAVGNKSEILKAIKAAQASELSMLKATLEQVTRERDEYARMAQAQANLVKKASSVVGENGRLKIQLVELASEEIELLSEAEKRQKAIIDEGNAKLVEANQKIAEQNAYFAGITGMPIEGTLPVGKE